MITKLKNILAKKLYQPPKNKDGLVSIINKAHADGIINIYSQNVIEKTLQLESMQVRDVMVPIGNMVTIRVNMDKDELFKTVVDSSHSRFPVIDSDRNEIHGILFAKDILNNFVNIQHQEFNCKEYLRASIVVPESKKLSVLLKEFQQKKSHMAMVVDEYETISGLITIEDVLEQIVGDIDDEHDLEKENIIAYKEGRFLIKAQTTIEEFNDFFTTKITSDSDTVAGLVAHQFGYLPKQSEEIDIGKFHFKVLQTDSRKLHLLEVIKL